MFHVEHTKERDNMKKDIYKEAYALGKAHGAYDRREGVYNDSPLSGEWAGESIPELLGDLWREVGDDGDLLQELCEEYEKGYESQNWQEHADRSAWNEVMN